MKKLLLIACAVLLSVVATAQDKVTWGRVGIGDPYYNNQTFHRMFFVNWSKGTFSIKTSLPNTPSESLESIPMKEHLARKSGPVKVGVTHLRWRNSLKLDKYIILSIEDNPCNVTTVVMQHDTSDMNNIYILFSDKPNDSVHVWKVENGTTISGF